LIVISYAFCALTFLLLAGYLLIRGKHPVKRVIGIAALVTSGWAAVSSVDLLIIMPTVAHYFELMRNIAWLFALLYLLKPKQEGAWLTGPLRQVVWIVLGLFGLLLAGDVVLQMGGDFFRGGAQYHIWYYQYLLLSISGMLLLEQLLRNADRDQLWAVKFFGVALGCQFAYDLFLYSEATLYGGINPLFWEARGVFFGLLAPFIGLAANRLANYTSRFLISPTLAFHSASLIGAGLYMVVMAGLAYAISIYGGKWGGILQVGFLGLAMVLLLAMVFSGQVRASLKVHLAKHFYRYKYDYRDEWLRFMGFFSGNMPQENLAESAIVAIASIVDSPAGLIWLKQQDGGYRLEAAWNYPETVESFAADAPLVRFLADKHWVVDVREYRGHPDMYDNLELPPQLSFVGDIRLVLPLLHQDELFGFLALAQPSADRDINWEDRDLLKTVGRQAAGYLALRKMSQELYDARQFEAFNRLSAYVVHDLKNVVAQLSLVGENAVRHRNNPAFVDDAFMTVEHAVRRMSKMLDQLRKNRMDAMEGTTEKVSLRETLQMVCQARQVSHPHPQLKIGYDQVAHVTCDGDRLAAIIEHIIQNAQDATADDGVIAVALERVDSMAVVDVQDNGSGMDQKFIKERLFKPFDTTKGNAGMGIGAYEVREFVQSLGGKVAVDSEPGMGTSFKIYLPIAL